MMFRIVAIAALALAAAGVNESRAATDAPTADQARAEERARAALAQQLKVAEDSLKVMRSTPQTWSDSSMGCGRKDTVALTVMTEGYAVVLSSGDKVYQVNVSGDNVVVCGDATLRRNVDGVARSRGLDVMMEQARQDLAKQLGVDASKIRLKGMTSKSFDDSSLGCPAPGEAVTAGPVAGFVLSLSHAGRIYTYNTDRKTVRACPPIAAE
jgi:hypothetical protein